MVPPAIETPAPQPRIEVPVVQPLETSRLPAPRSESPATVAPREPQAAPRVAPPVERATPPASSAPGTSPRDERSTAPTDQGATPSPFRTSPAPRAQGNDYDPTAPAPKLDVDAMRKRATEITRAGTGNRAVLPFPMPPVDKPRTRMEDAIEKARKPDCRTAYKDLGLLAVVPLVANEFGEGTCRW